MTQELLNQVEAAISEIEALGDAAPMNLRYAGANLGSASVYLQRQIAVEKAAENRAQPVEAAPPPPTPPDN